MFFKSLTSITLASLLALATAREPACFNHPGPLQRTGGNKHVSIESCTGICREANYIIAGAMGGNQCWCGNAIPEQSNQIPATSCDVTCNGAKDEKCMFQFFLRVLLVVCSVPWYMESAHANATIGRWRRRFLVYLGYSCPAC